MKNADFSYPDNTSRPPFVMVSNLGPAGRLTPEDIIGPAADDLRKHYIIYCSRETDEQRVVAFSRKGITPAAIDMAAEMYKALRDNGYYVVGLDPNGRIELAVVTDSHPGIEREYTPEECKEARKEFKEIANRTKGPIGDFLKKFT